MSGKASDYFKDPLDKVPYDEYCSPFPYMFIAPWEAVALAEALTTLCSTLSGVPDLILKRSWPKGVDGEGLNKALETAHEAYTAFRMRHGIWTAEDVENGIDTEEGRREGLNAYEVLLLCAKKAEDMENQD